MKFILLLSLIASTQLHALSINNNAKKAHVFTAGAEHSAVWESECRYSMKTTIIATKDVKDVALRAYTPFSNCKGEPIAIFKSEFALSFEEGIAPKNIFVYYEGSTEIGYNKYSHSIPPTYSLKRKAIKAKFLGSDVTIMNSPLSYFSSCLDKEGSELIYSEEAALLKENQDKTKCPIRGLDQKVISFRKSRIHFVTPRQFFVDLDHNIEPIKFFLKSTD